MPVSPQNELFSSLELRFNQSGGFADLSFRGAITLELLNNAFMRLIEHPLFNFNMNACYNYCDAYPEIEMPDIEEHAHFVAQHLSERGQTYKLAMVTDDTLGTALLSIYKLLIARTAVEAEVFSRKTHAVRWLMEDD